MRRWTALERARLHDRAARLPFRVDGREVGSVPRRALARVSMQCPGFVVDERAVELEVPAAQRDSALAMANQALRAAGLIAGWRDETIPLLDPATGQALATLERAAARFWGSLTLGAHATGWIAGADGRPAALWIARRALSKATDPGLYDNLVGGGVPAGQTPLSTLEREAWEEAGLPRDRWRQLSPGRTIALERDVPEGLQREWLHSWDIELHPEDEPRNQDGEVESFTLVPVAQALDLAAGREMTVDASLVTLDFALRRGLLPAAEHQALAPRLAALQA